MKEDVCKKNIYSKLSQKKLRASKKKKIGLGKISNIFFYEMDKIFRKRLNNEKICS